MKRVDLDKPPFVAKPARYILSGGVLCRIQPLVAVATTRGYAWRENPCYSWGFSEAELFAKVKKAVEETTKLLS